MCSEWFTRIEQGDLNYVVQHIKEKGGLQDDQGFTGLMIASSFVSKLHFEIVRHLVQIEIGYTTLNGQTALMMAAIVNNVNVVELLKDEVGMRDNNGFTASAWARHAGSRQFLEYINQYESDSILAGPAETMENTTMICNIRFRNMSFGTRPSELSQEFSSIQQLNQMHDNYISGISQQQDNPPLTFWDDIGIFIQGVTQNDVQMVQMIVNFDQAQSIQYYKLLYAIQRSIEKGRWEKIDILNGVPDNEVYNALKCRFGDLIEYFIQL